MGKQKEQMVFTECPYNIVTLLITISVGVLFYLGNFSSFLVEIFI